VKVVDCMMGSLVDMVVVLAEPWCTCWTPGRSLPCSIACCCSTCHVRILGVGSRWLRVLLLPLGASQAVKEGLRWWC
jgi:hypothetical protein